MIKEKIFVPLTDDLLFKEAMCHIHNRKQLIRFLSLTTELPERIIKRNLQVSYESILDKVKYQDKAMRGDVIIHFDNYIVNLECYSYFDNNSFKKSTSYIMRLFSTHLDRGEDYDCLESMIQINLIDNVDMNFNNKLISRYGIVNLDDLNDIKLEKDFVMKYYRIDKVKEIPYNENDELARWLQFIEAESIEERKKVAKGDELLMEFDKWIEEYVNDEKTKDYYGKWAENIALKKGIKKGIKQGIEQGIEQGVHDNSIEIAKRLIDMNLSISDVAKATKLSEEEVNKLVG